MRRRGAQRVAPEPPQPFLPRRHERRQRQRRWVRDGAGGGDDVAPTQSLQRNSRRFGVAKVQRRDGCTGGVRGASASVRSPRRAVVYVVDVLPELVVVVCIVGHTGIGYQIGRELVRGEPQQVRHHPHVALAAAAVAIRAEAGGGGADRESPEEHGDVGERQPEPGGRRFLPPHLRDVLPPTLNRSAVARVPHPAASEHRQ